MVTRDLSQCTCDFSNGPIAPGAAVESVAINIPTFDPIDPELWFIQCEAQFALKNVMVDRWTNGLN